MNKELDWLPLGREIMSRLFFTDYAGTISVCMDHPFKKQNKRNVVF